jgi:hypothetical protein
MFEIRFDMRKRLGVGNEDFRNILSMNFNSSKLWIFWEEFDSHFKINFPTDLGIYIWSQLFKTYHKNETFL